jgi:predicted AAA+ superfamily ATPase
MWIKREISEKIQHACTQLPALVLTGARQTGKTSLLKNIFPNHSFVSLDLPSMAEEAETNSEAFLDRFKEPVIIDEIQYAPGLFRHLKARIDEDRQKSGRFILTGSQKFTLMKGLSESLAGRIAVYELETLSLREITQGSSEWTPARLNELILRGGFPELYARTGLDPQIFYPSYLSTYLERDLRAILEVGSLRDFERFMRLCALRSGQLLNRSEIARDCGISVPTVSKWLSALEASNQISLLEPWFANGSKSVIKSPKLYWCDTGLLLALLNITTVDELARSPLLGAIWETAVYAELRKRQRTDRGSLNLFFWRDRGKEVDFIVPKGGRFDLVECKWNESPGVKETEGFEAFSSEFGRSAIDSQTIICRTQASYYLGEGKAKTRVEPLF